MLIVILGGGISLSGKLPQHVYQRLDKAIEIYQKSKTAKIVVSGRYSFLFNQLKKYPPTTEAEKMAQYLLKKDIPKNKILLEKKSKDTLGNAYYLKKDIFLSHQEKEAIIITSYFHLKRVKYIFNKVFGPSYKFQYIGVKENLPPEKMRKVLLRQKQLLFTIKQILSPMKPGNHLTLKGKLYKLKYYREKRPKWVIDFVAKGK